MICFISDLHLSESLPALSRLFEHALNVWHGKIEALYILGDLFDSWIGDDDDNPYYLKQIQLLKRFSESTPLYIMRGNRDFLLGEKFSENSGAMLLADPYCFSYKNHRYILSHGDILCTKDIEYQQYRLMTQNPAWQAEILSKSLSERRKLAQQLRFISNQSQSKYSDADVNEEAVKSMFISFASNGKLPEFLLHGHTHRPFAHTQIINGEKISRIVLADWYDDLAYFIKLDENGLSVQQINMP